MHNLCCVRASVATVIATIEARGKLVHRQQSCGARWDWPSASANVNSATASPPSVGTAKPWPRKSHHCATRGTLDVPCATFRSQAASCRLPKHCT